jgi:hypothetical protein
MFITSPETQIAHANMRSYSQTAMYSIMVTDELRKTFIITGSLPIFLIDFNY